MSRLNISNSNLQSIFLQQRIPLLRHKCLAGPAKMEVEYSQDQVGAEADVARRAATAAGCTTPRTPDLSGGPISPDENSCCLRPARKRSMRGVTAIVLWTSSVSWTFREMRKTRLPTRFMETFEAYLRPEIPGDHSSECLPASSAKPASSAFSGRDYQDKIPADRRSAGRARAAGMELDRDGLVHDGASCKRAVRIQLRLSTRRPRRQRTDLLRAWRGLYQRNTLHRLWHGRDIRGDPVLRASLADGEILALPGTYAETLELIGQFTPSLQLVFPRLPLATTRTSLPRILLLDSSLPAETFGAILRSTGTGLDLLVFDTTCFAVRSGRIRRVLVWAQHHQVPVVMVRSHNKLDSLGAEYGRLGSVVFVRWNDVDEAKRSIVERLTTAVCNAIRLLGGAALPAHFPPYVGREAYWLLTKKRVAAILRNGRHTARLVARALPLQSAQLHFTHGLYITLRAKKSLDEERARQTAEALSRDLRLEGYAIRHAGSFGFDFATAEWVRDATTTQYSVRVAVPDLPTGLWNDLSAAIVRWWGEI